MNEYMVIKQYEPLIKKTIKMYVKHKEYYQDAYQECSLAIINAVRRYSSEKGNFTAYIKCTIIYSIKGFASKLKENISLDEELEDGGSLYELIPSDVDLEGDYFKSQDIKKLYKALNNLNQKQREIIYEYFFKGKSMVEIAKSRRCHYNSIVKLKERALLNLRKEMERL